MNSLSSDSNSHIVAHTSGRGRVELSRFCAPTPAAADRGRLFETHQSSSLPNDLFINFFKNTHILMMRLEACFKPHNLQSAVCGIKATINQF